MAETRTRMTAEDLLRLPDDGKRYELVAGELIEMSPANPEQGFVAARLVARLVNHVDDNGIDGAVFTADAGFRLSRDPDTVRAPDVCFVADAERVALARRSRGFPDLIPDLVVEIVSPSDRANDVHHRALAWLEAGARLVVIIFPEERSATVYQPGTVGPIVTSDGRLTLDPVLPGFSCRLSELF